jgi:hypothetical protein
MELFLVNEVAFKIYSEKVVIFFLAKRAFHFLVSSNVKRKCRKNSVQFITSSMHQVPVNLPLEKYNIFAIQMEKTRIKEKLICTELFAFQ